MKSEKIQKLFIEYIKTLGENRKYANDDEIPALIYGSDQFKIDIKKSRIRIEELGWIEIEDIISGRDLKNIEWVAIKISKDDYELIVSSDKDPFSQNEKNPMYVDGQVFGVPVGIETNLSMYLNSLL